MSDELTNEELRKKIATERGWTNLYMMAFAGTVIPYGDDPDNHYASRPIPNWPEDIAAAWELVEEVRKFDINMLNRYTWELSSGSPLEKWYAEITDWNRDNGSLHWRTESDTAPRAISLAYLAWKEGMK